MYSQKYFGEPVQILKFNPINRKFELDDEKLKQIFLQEHLANVNLSVVSIAGAFRKGKSFLLSFFLRYLNVLYNDECGVIGSDAQWLQNESSKLSGFEWRGGSERHTTGIWMWSKVFTKTINGERIGIVLMDTQGTFDNVSSMHQNATIFGLSILLSSIQIYNLFNNIQEDDLQHLQLFTEYGRMANRENANDSKPFQQLMFLIRDWNFEYEHSFGSIGGYQKLKKTLEINSNQSTENQSVRKYLKDCFDEITCFLMPHPGEKARSDQYFNGKLSDISTSFVEHINQLVPFLLKPENVVRNGLKRIQGALIKPAQFCNLIRQYWKVFNSGTIPEAKSILTATSEAVCLTAKSEACKLYQTMITRFTESDDIDLPQMLNIHKNLADEAIQLFDRKAIIGDTKIRNLHRQELKESLQENVLYYIGINQRRKTNSMEETIRQMSEEMVQLRARNIDSSDLVMALQNQLEIFESYSSLLQFEFMEQVERRIANLTEINQPPSDDQSRNWCSVM